MPEDVSPGVRRQAREADQLPPINYEMKIVELYLSTPTYLHGVVLNHRDTFTFRPSRFNYYSTSAFRLESTK